MHNLPIVDGHLDLAENVTLFGFDLTATIFERRRRENRTSRQATVTAGFLAEDVVGVSEDFLPRSAIYRTPEEAEAQALKQIALYETWQREGRVRLIKSSTDLDHHLELWRDDRKPGLVLLMEGADPVVKVDDLPTWWRRGLRMIGVTYGDTAYGRGVAGGSTEFKRGGLTEAGFALLDRMAELGLIWDVSHLAEDGVWQGLDRGFPCVCASHANARALLPTDRHLSDEGIRAISDRGGVIGLVLYNGFLDQRWSMDHSVDVSLGDQLRRHAEHIASVGGWECVGIGSDLDGGLGLEESPVEIETETDVCKVGDVIPPGARDAVLSGNWLRFLKASLPTTSE